MWSDSSDSEQRKVVDFCEHGDELSASLKAGNFFTSYVIIRFER
jgi:hypothetical protein